MSNERIEVPQSDLSSSGPSISPERVPCPSCGHLKIKPAYCDRCEGAGILFPPRPASVPPGPAAPPPEPLRALVERWCKLATWSTDPVYHGMNAAYMHCADELAALLAGPAAPQTAAPTDPFESLLKLEANWDGYGAPPLDRERVEAARRFLSTASVVPCVSGGVQLEWHMLGVDLEIEFAPGQPVLFYLRDPVRDLDLVAPDDGAQTAAPTEKTEDAPGGR